MRKIIVAAATAGLLSLAGPAFAGNSTGTQDTENASNDVSCGPANPAVPGTGVQVNTAGGPDGGAAVVCNDNKEGAQPAPVKAPIEGRVIAAGSTTGGGWIAADGDKDNEGTAADGWARVDFGTGGPRVRCGGPEGGWNSEAPASGNQAYCG